MLSVLIPCKQGVMFPTARVLGFQSERVCPDDKLSCVRASHCVVHCQAPQHCKVIASEASTQG